MLPGVTIRGQGTRSSTINDKQHISSRLLRVVRHNLPGMEFRINSNGFLYASLLAKLIINNEIERLRLQPLKRCFQQFNGCITISNLVILRYQCPKLVSLLPSPPNRLIFVIQNLDLEIRGNINGKIRVLLPIKLNNTVYLRIHQISAIVRFFVYRTLNGSLYVRTIGCHVSVGFSDIFLQNDDLIGNIFNTYFRSNGTEQIRKQLSFRVCKIIRNIVKRKINAPFRNMPKIISFSKLFNFGKTTINSIKLIGFTKPCRMPLCREKIQNHATITHFPISTVNLSTVSDTKSMFTGNVNNQKSLTMEMKYNDNMDKVSDMPSLYQLSSTHAKTSQSITLSPSQIDAPNFLDPCADCYSINKSIPFQNLDNLIKHINEILSNAMLNMRLTKVSATFDYFHLGLRAALNTEGKMDEKLFDPFPMHFQQFYNGSKKRMLDVKIVINFRNDAIMFRIGPETPKLGRFLKTTCADDDYDDFGNFDVNEDEDFDDDENSTITIAKFIKRRKRNAANDDSDNDKNDNMESNEEKEMFNGLEICIGDIMPAVQHKYPKKLMHIKIYSKRTPTITLSAERNGTVRVDLELEAVLYIDDSGEKIGTMLISSIIDGNIHISANRVNIQVEIKSLKLVDKDNTLQLSPDALDNLANLSKDVIAQTANNELSNGLIIELSMEKLKYNLVKPKFSIIDHAIHISTDFNIPASILGIISSTIC
ncbi:unnamed protein product [Cercopithifilaria johnstoni]|uniref:Lipid-binding serum glycoprotein N-terminal domain-containing protein n=1 Tax=Cercopithifilaria johnstoni TaxID=2874296 RepID=A0A8J2M8S0_9BILA|nr:unnamed protein product [Cercopithifilaria johnstoni]